MIDLNHQSGCQYEAPSRGPGVGLAINAAIDEALVAETARSRRGTMSARPDSAANACGRSSTIILPSQRMTVANSNRTRCASSRPAIVPRTS